MAAVAAGPVFRLLGAKDLGESDDYQTEKMPAVNVGLLDGQLAWRQHDGGHTDAPNWKYFIPWADRFLQHAPAPAGSGARRQAGAAQRSEFADRARATAREGAGRRHRHLLRRRFDRPPLGRDRLPGPPRQLEPELLRLERRRLRLGRRQDRRTSSGAWKTASSTASTRRSSCCSPAPTTSADDPATPPRSPTSRAASTSIVDDLPAEGAGGHHHPHRHLPAQRQHGGDAGDRSASTPTSRTLADGKTIRFLNVNDKLADKDGRLFDGMMNERDKLHPDPAGLPGLGRRAEADLYRTARPARRDRPRAAAHRRSQRATQVVIEQQVRFSRSRRRRFGRSRPSPSWPVLRPPSHATRRGPAVRRRDDRRMPRARRGLAATAPQ